MYADVYRPSDSCAWVIPARVRACRIRSPTLRATWLLSTTTTLRVRVLLGLMWPS